MKFWDGYWGLRENVKLLNPVEFRDLAVSAASLTLYGTCKKTNHRGDTLNAPMITTVFSSPLDDVIHVRSFHFKGVLDRGPCFDLLSDRERGNQSEGATRPPSVPVPFKSKRTAWVPGARWFPISGGI
jgi:hypothetical protein